MIENLEDFLKGSRLFKKFELDDLLFVEIVCPAENDKDNTTWWWHNNFFSYAISGKEALKTLQGEYVVQSGDCIFAKKGTIVSSRHLTEADFCELRVFVSDDFVRSVFHKYRLTSPPAEHDSTDTVIPLPPNEVLEVYFHSLLTYFHQPTPPSESLLRLKFEELLVNIITRNIHPPLTNFFRTLSASTKPSIREIMEANFFKNLSLPDFARLCGRSLSSFKTEFKAIFKLTPGQWLLEKRLDYSRYLLETTDMNIEEICMTSGFENRSHFNRVFKRKYSLTPHDLTVRAKELV